MRDSASATVTRERARRWSRAATIGGRVVAHERRRDVLGAVAGHVARPEDALCAGLARAPRVEPAVQRGSAPRRARRRRSTRSRGLDRARLVDLRCRSAPSRRPAAPAAGQSRRHDGRVEVEPERPAARDLVRARRARCRARSTSSSAAIVSGSLGCPAARSRCISSAAAPATCGAEADVPTIARPGHTAVEAGATSIGLEAPVLGRTLRGVVGGGVALASRARPTVNEPRASPGVGMLDSTVGLVAELDAAAEDLEVADRRLASACGTRSPYVPVDGRHVADRARAGASRRAGPARATTGALAAVSVMSSW